MGSNTYRHVGGNGALCKAEGYRADIEDEAGAPPAGGCGEDEENDGRGEKERREDCCDQ